MAKQLVQVVERVLGSIVVHSVNLRDLWEALEIGTQYTDWAKDQIDTLNLVEHVDYEVFQENLNNPQGGRPKTEYVVTMVIAKHIAMMAKGEKAFQVRQYFIDLEEAYKEHQRQLTPAQLLHQITGFMLRVEEEQIVSQKRIQLLEARVDREEYSNKTIEFMQAKQEKHEKQFQDTVNEVHGRLDHLEGRDGYYTVKGFFKVGHYKYPGKNVSQALGRSAKKLCKERNIDIKKVTDIEYGEVNAYPGHILEEVFAEFSIQRKHIA